MIRQFVAALALFVLVSGCIYQEPDRVYEAADCPSIFLPPPPDPVIVSAPEEPPPDPVAEPMPVQVSVPASALKGFFNCYDACGIIDMGGCNDLETQCGLKCGTDYEINDACEAFSTVDRPLEFVVSSYAAPKSCTEATWVPPICAKDGTPFTVAYCCTVDGSPLGK